MQTQNENISSQIEQKGLQGLREWPEDNKCEDKFIPSATTPDEEQLKFSDTDQDLNDSIIPDTSDEEEANISSGNGSSSTNDNIPLNKCMVTKKVPPRRSPRTSPKKTMTRCAAKKRKITEYFNKKKDQSMSTSTNENQVCNEKENNQIQQTDTKENSDDKPISNLVRTRKSSRNRTPSVEATQPLQVEKQKKKRMEPSTRKKEPLTRKDKKTNDGKRQKAKTNQLTYKSNLHPMLEKVTQLQNMKNITSEIKEKMNTTPFAHLFHLFDNGDLKKEDVKKPHGVIHDIMSCFNPTKKSFTFGGKEVQFTAEDVALVFGLPMKGKEVALHCGTVKELSTSSSFYTRNFSKQSHSVTKEQISTSMDLCVGRKDEHYTEDMCILLIMYMFCTILNPGPSTIFRTSCLQHLIDDGAMNGIAWAKVIHSRLFKEMESWDPIKCNLYTCSIILVPFLLEHVEIIGTRPKHDESIPRAERWSFKGLKIPKTLKTNKGLKVETKLMARSDIEFGLLEDGMIVDDSSLATVKEKLKEALEENSLLQKKISELTTRNKFLEKEVERLQPVDSSIENEKNHGINDISREMDDTLQLVESSLEKGKYQGFNEISREMGDGLQTVERSFDKENDKGFDEIIREMEDERLVRSLTENYDQGLNERLEPVERTKEDLEAPSFDLGISPSPSPEEDAIQTLNNQITPPPIKEKSPRQEKTRSMVRDIRNRHNSRKTTQKFDFEYQKKTKKKDVSTIEISDSPVVNTPPEFKQMLPKIERKNCYKHMYTFAQKTIKDFFTFACTSTRAYDNPTTKVHVLGSDLAAMVENKFVGPNIIEWFAEFMLNKEDNKVQTYIFHPTLWYYVRFNHKRAIEVNLIEILKNLQDVKKYDFLLFPMNSTKTDSPTDKVGHHWSLLVFDCKLFEWKHYNSLNGRKYLNDAKKFKTKIAEIIMKNQKFRKQEIARIEGEVISTKSPQQEVQSVDCATYVTKFIESILKGCDPENSDIETFNIEIQKGLICYNVLNDERYSWKREENEVMYSRNYGDEDGNDWEK